MERWQNCVAVVTGASSGIGEALVKDLLKANLIVVGLARRKQRMDEYKTKLPADQQQRFHTYKCDVSSKQSVDEAFDWIIKELGGVDILVNNAGITWAGQAVTMDVAKMEQVLQVNVMGVVYCTQRVFQSMKERDFAGHVLITNSILGHTVLRSPPGNAPRMNVYPSSKHAVTAITEIYRQEFSGLGTKIKITSISPGLTDTEIVSEAYKTPERPILKAEDVAQCIMFAISTPPNVQIHEIIVKPLLGE